jgi:hypothetical protein
MFEKIFELYIASFVGGIVLGFFPIIIGFTVRFLINVLKK